MKEISAKAFPILCNFYNLQQYYHKHYSFPSQLKIIKLIYSKYGVKVSVATLNRWLGEMELRGFIRRKRRIRVTKTNGYEFRSTLYTIRRKGYILLRNAGVLANAAIKKVVKAPKDQYRKAQELISGMFKEGDMLFSDYQLRHKT